MFLEYDLDIGRLGRGLLKHGIMQRVVPHLVPPVSCISVTFYHKTPPIFACHTLTTLVAAVIRLSAETAGSPPPEVV